MKELSPRQEQIVQSSLQIISRQGIQNLTIKNLAHEIAVTEGAIYRHFSSKYEILTTIAKMYKSSSSQVLREIVDSDTLGLKKVELFFMSRLRQFFQNRGLVLVMLSEDIFKNYAGLQKTIHSTIQSHKKLIIKALADAQNDGIVHRELNPDHLFLIIMGSLRLLTTRWRGAGFKFDLLSEGRSLWRSLEKLIAIDSRGVRNEEKNYSH